MLHKPSPCRSGKLRPSKRVIQYLICLTFLLPTLSCAETLKQLISTALQGHPAIQSQQAQEQVAKAGVESAAWQLFPTPSIAIENAHASTTDLSHQGNDTVSTLRLQQTLWAGGRLTSGMDKAQAGVMVSQASLEDTRQQLALRVVQAYGDWLAAYLKSQANEKSLATHSRLREQVKRRIAQGASPESDFILAVSRLKSVVADIATTLAQKDIALARLGQLIGRRIDDASLLASIAIPQTVNSNLQTQLDQALTANPSIQKSQAQSKIQEAVMAERRADLSPEIYVRAERQYGNYSYSSAAPENRIFVGINSRFGAGLSSLSNIDGAKAQYQAALADVESQNRVVSEQVLADYALATSSESRLEALKATLEAADLVSQSYDRQFLAGHKTWLDVMNAARELSQTASQLADAQSTQVVVTWRLAIYTRGLLSVIGDKQ